MPVLRKGDVLGASVDIAVSPASVYRLVSDVTRIPEWSPETVRVELTGPAEFRAWNRRRLGRWRTSARIVEAVPDERFAFLVHVLGKEWTQWTYRVEPGATPGSCRLNEEFRMCAPLPFGALVFEWLFLFVRDRPADLESNLRTSLDRIRTLAESTASARPERR